VLRTFAHAAKDADIALIEGVMGLFDGADPQSDVGSTAEIAKWLDAPVILVADVSGMARTIDAIALGFSQYDPLLNVAGLLANRAGSAGHMSIIKKSCRSLPMLGGLPRQTHLQFPERHLGLVAALQQGEIDSSFEAWAQVADEYIDWDAVLTIARNAPPLNWPRENDVVDTDSDSDSACVIAYAYDEAFHFYYDDNLNLLRRNGARLLPFSPLKNEVPPPCQGIYIGGGYPEIFAEELARNEITKTALRKAAASGIPIYAECGGFMYLSEGIRKQDGSEHEMVGLLPGILQMHDKLQSLGYAEVEILEDSILGEAGTRFRGHEFRYSTYASGQDGDRAIYKIRKRRNQEIRREGYQTRSVLGSYIHAHWASNPAIAANFVLSCRKMNPCHD
jgi:cobyrinic acid a,c-diamide synthase